MAAAIGLVPGVDLFLEGIAHREEFAVARRKVRHDGAEAFPEGRRVDARAWKGFLLDEVVKLAVDLEAGGRDTLAHDALSLGWIGCAPW